MRSPTSKRAESAAPTMHAAKVQPRIGCRRRRERRESHSDTVMCACPLWKALMLSLDCEGPSFVTECDALKTINGRQKQISTAFFTSSRVGVTIGKAPY